MRPSICSHTAQPDDRGEATDLFGDLHGSGPPHHLEVGHRGKIWKGIVSREFGLLSVLKVTVTLTVTMTLIVTLTVTGKPDVNFAVGRMHIIICCT